MSSIPADQIRSILQTVSVITVGAGELPFGGPIAAGFVRKFTRIHVPADLVNDLQVSLLQASVNTPAGVIIDTFTQLNGNPDFVDDTDNLEDPLIVIRPDEIPLTLDPPVPDDVTNITSIRRIGANNVRMTISFYDERQ